jgi:hypothetical protein
MLAAGRRFGAHQHDHGVGAPAQEAAPTRQQRLGVGRSAFGELDGRQSQRRVDVWGTCSEGRLVYVGKIFRTRESFL